MDKRHFTRLFCHRFTNRLDPVPDRVDMRASNTVEIAFAIGIVQVDAFTVGSGLVSFVPASDAEDVGFSGFIHSSVPYSKGNSSMDCVG